MGACPPLLSLVCFRYVAAFSLKNKRSRVWKTDVARSDRLHELGFVEVPSLFSILLAMLIVSTRFAIRWREMGRDAFDAWSILILLVLGIIFSHAVRRMLLSLRTASSDLATGTRQIAGLWCGLTLAAIVLWPWGASESVHACDVGVDGVSAWNPNGLG